MRSTALPIPRRLLASLALAAALLLAPGHASAQAGAIFGRVVNPTGEPVEGAAITATPASGGGARRTSSGSDGAYRLTGLRAGTWTLRATRLGYAAAVAQVTVGAEEQRVELRLADQAVVLDPVEVRSRRDTDRERTRFETEGGTTTRVITGDEIKILPGLGEADVLRAVEVLPGVVSTSDFSSAFNVRGGSSDQNLILLDGFPIFNPFHLGGLFSVFNSDVIARAELLSGGFGAEYGGRVSSVLTVESDAGDGELGADMGVSVLASRLAVRGGFPGGGRGFVAARRSYFDALLRPVTDFPYHLTDLQAGATMELRGGGRLQFSGYTGEDVLDLSDFEAPGSDDEDDSILRVRWDWGNNMAGLRWTQPLDARTVGETRLGFSRYAASVVFPDFDDTRFTSSIMEAALRSDVTRQLSGSLTAQAGGEVTWMEYENRADAGGTSFFGNGRNGTFGAAYGQLRWHPTPAWILEPGLRVDVARSNAGACADGGETEIDEPDVGEIAPRPNRTCVLLSPRLAVKRFLGQERDAAIKVAVGRYVQFLHSIRDEALPVSNDTWVLADESVPPIVSDQVQVGIEKYWGDRWYASAEAYYRTYDGVTDFNIADDPNDPGDDLLTGEGDSYGLDLLVRRSTGRLTGWTTISLLRAERSFPDPLAAGIDGVPQTVTFPPIFDRRVDVDLVLQYRLPRELEVGARWNYGSGTPYTRPVAQVVSFETDVADGGYRLPRAEGDDPDVPYYIVPGDRNRERYPAYHRLDLTLRRPYVRRWGTFTPYVQVLNVYNQRNVLFYFFNYDKTPPTRSGISMFPILPSIGVEASF